MSSGVEVRCDRSERKTKAVDRPITTNQRVARGLRRGMATDLWYPVRTAGISCVSGISSFSPVVK